MTQPANFTQALIAAYRENPCEVLPNALWKSIFWADKFQTDFRLDNGNVTQLMAWSTEQWMLYWNRDRHFPQQFPLQDHGALRFALLHKDFEDLLPLETFPNRQRYFRLLHPMRVLPAPDLSEGFSFVVADSLTDSEKIAQVINTCYADINLTSDVIRSWKDHPVFTADLWVWVIDEKYNQPAGLGIAEFDSSIAEGSLEWIQILPAYRGKGLGKHLVNELLMRLSDRAEFVTVAGQLDNQTNPEKLYRSCGFKGDDQWWVLRK